MRIIGPETFQGHDKNTSKGEDTVRKQVLTGAAIMAAMTAMIAATAGRTQPAAPDGAAVFNGACSGCHTKEAKAGLGQAAIVEALTKGIMAPVAQANNLNAAQIQAVANYITGAPPAAAPPAPPPGGRGGAGAAPDGGAAAAPGGRGGPAAAGGRGGGRGGAPQPTLTDKMCEGPAPAITAMPSDWPMAGYNVSNSRYNPTPGLKAADVKKLKVKWTMSVPGNGNTQPVVIGNWMWMLGSTATYAMDPRTGCLRWKLDATTAGTGARNTPVVMRSSISPSGWLLIVAPRNRQIKALDAQNGHVIWTSEAIDNTPEQRGAGITGSPLVAGNQIFVPTTSGIEGTGGRDVACCTFRGGLVALDLTNGRIQWTVHTITEPLRDIRMTAGGNKLQGPAGGAIWSAPTADLKRGLIYVATGDSYTEADTTGADAIIAYNMKDGSVKWLHQVTEKDNFVMNCTGTQALAKAKQNANNCPMPAGPDYDFGSSPILMKGSNGKDIVVSGQKSGIAYGMDADTGRLLWKTTVGAGSSLGGIEWGIASAPGVLFAGNSDVVNMFDAAARLGGKDNSANFDTPLPPAQPGLTAININNGRVLWHIVPPVAPCNPPRTSRVAGDGTTPCYNAMSAAPAVIPGAVFEGTTDGWFRAYDTRDGKLLWEHSTTAQTYATINGAPAQPGGAIDGDGPVIAGGMVFVTSGHDGAIGYGGNGTNVLIAYSVDGK